MKKEKPTTKLCKHCKTEIPYDAKVCPNCRKKQKGGKLKCCLLYTSHRTAKPGRFPYLIGCLFEQFAPVCQDQQDVYKRQARNDICFRDQSCPVVKIVLVIFTSNRCV